jgi:hypothetical protein
MYHFDIPKTRQYDTGKIEVIARNSAGEAITTTELQVISRKDDYRGVLKNSPRRKFFLFRGEIKCSNLKMNFKIKQKNLNKRKLLDKI